ncbi:MAG: hypothetical protein NTY77_15875 [Elusimicrobia bacterium]|nr:hypothetical protein [Elusimicrobiota bacterium]
MKTLPDAAARTPIKEEDYSSVITPPYLLGAYLAINAIPDAVILMDSPPCFPLKTPAIQGNHDWFSTLSTVAGQQRCVTTGAHPDTVVFSRRKVMLSQIETLAKWKGSGGIFVTARPMAACAGEDYPRILREARESTAKKLFFIPAKSLRSSWLGGYEETLLALAQGLDLKAPAPAKDKVAVVGYLFDRHEGDHSGNLAELRRYLGALGLKLETVWLSGQKLADLSRVKNAGLIVSLPYGRKAARVLAERLKVPLVETCLPFGFSATEQFLRDVGKASGRQAKAERLIEAELSRTAPLLEWVIPFVFQDAAIGFVGDPNHLAGLKDIARMLGARLSFAFLTGLASQWPRSEAVEDPVPEFDPKQKAVLKRLAQEQHEAGLDLLVACNIGTRLPRMPVCEFGYPSYFTHALAPYPFLGFNGCVAFVNSMANTIRHAQLF